MLNYKRRKTNTVQVAGLAIGSDYPVRVQSMTSTDTMDTEASVAQCKRIAQAGAQLVRLTAQGQREAANIGIIRQRLHADGCQIPLCADIHFNPKAAITAAGCCDKVRINPGNFVDAARTFRQLTFTDEEYAAELEKIRQALLPFIATCKLHHTAVRLGVNHGSLSDRIMSRYGDTPAGMVESAMEFLRVFDAEGFHNVVISIKASNTVVMVETVRRLVEAMNAEAMHYPLHLGVTEAGDGEDGRVKSAVGIGTLLAEGIGDTIRVSLSEEPEAEVPVAQKLVQYIASRQGDTADYGHEAKGYNHIRPERRKTRMVDNLVGGNKKPVVIASCPPDAIPAGTPRPDFFFALTQEVPVDDNRYIVEARHYNGQPNTTPLFDIKQVPALLKCKAPIKWLEIASHKDVSMLEPLRNAKDVVLVLSPTGQNVTASLQSFLHRLTDAAIKLPAVAYGFYMDTDLETLQVKAGTDMGTLLLNGFSDGIWVGAPRLKDKAATVSLAFGILQAARQRISKTEYISCPSCGRTMFHLQDTLAQVKAATAHLQHLKIGVMGCIVNGPGEMADADYGYVGAAAGKVSLYKGKQCIEKNIPQEQAIQRLVALIKDGGDWTEPPTKA